MPAFSSHIAHVSMPMAPFLNVLSLLRLSGCSVCVSGVCGLVPVSCAVFAEFFGILRSFSAVCGLCLRSADSAVFGVTAQRFVGVDPTLKLPYGEFPDHPKGPSPRLFINIILYFPQSLTVQSILHRF